MIHTTAPARRVDVEREIDLIEEICRLNGLDAVPVADTLPIRVERQNPVERGTRAAKDLLVGIRMDSAPPVGVTAVAPNTSWKRCRTAVTAMRRGDT